MFTLVVSLCAFALMLAVFALALCARRRSYGRIVVESDHDSFY